MKIGERGQVTIPKHLRERYGFQKSVEVEFVAEEGGVQIRKRRPDIHPAERVRGIIKLKHADTVDEYIEEIRGT